VLFAYNHNVMMDSALTIMALPAKWRWRLSPAAEATAVFARGLRGPTTILLGNCFPFAREGAVRSSLEHLGQLLGWGWSVLIFPEGNKFLDGLHPFKPGTGLIAVQNRTPVVPMRVKLRRGGVFDRTSFLSRLMTGQSFSDSSGGENGSGRALRFSRGAVEIHFGQPLSFSRNTDYLDATARIEEAVKAL
jgi:long-chain acyl-CoA synthetase